MNMKKTLAGLMAGVVAISAMATVAVSAKAQKADSCTWSILVKENKAAETIVYVTIDQTKVADYWKDGFGLSLQWASAAIAPKTGALGAGDVNDLEIVEVTKVTNRKAANATVEDEDLERLYDVRKVAASGKKNVITFTTTPIDAGAEVELAIKVKAPNGYNIAKNSIIASAATAAVTLNGTGEAVDYTQLTLVSTTVANKIGSTNVKKDASTGKVGMTINNGYDNSWITVADYKDNDPGTGIQAIVVKDGNGNIVDTAATNNSLVDAKALRKNTVMVKNLDVAINAHYGNPTNRLEPTYEMADYLKDAKGATISFNFNKKAIDETVADTEFGGWVNRYDWNSEEMKSAISLRVNDSDALSVDMMEFDKTNFAAVYSWDEVMAKFQVGSAAGLVRTMGLKINNEKLPAQKDDADKVIDLVIDSITIKIPEMAETNDDSMVEDFAAGESATVVEDTLPAATDAPASTDAPAATDAPATTDGAANPETGNSAIALLAIPAALAAAAIVAKKRG